MRLNLDSQNVNTLAQEKKKKKRKHGLINNPNMADSERKILARLSILFLNLDNHVEHQRHGISLWILPSETQQFNQRHKTRLREKKYPGMFRN